MNHFASTISSILLRLCSPSRPILVDRYTIHIHTRLDPTHHPLATSVYQLRLSRRPVTATTTLHLLHSTTKPNTSRWLDLGLRYLSAAELSLDNTGPVQQPHSPRPSAAAQRGAKTTSPARWMKGHKHVFLQELQDELGMCCEEADPIVRETDGTILRRRMPRPTRRRRRKIRMRLYRPPLRSHLRTSLDLYGLTAVISSSGSKMYGVSHVSALSMWHS